MFIDLMYLELFLKHFECISHSKIGMIGRTKSLNIFKAQCLSIHAIFLHDIYMYFCFLFFNIGNFLCVFPVFF